MKPEWKNIEIKTEEDETIMNERTPKRMNNETKIKEYRNHNDRMPKSEWSNDESNMEKKRPESKIIEIRMKENRNHNQQR